MNRCWGLTRNFRRCGRVGQWRFFCHDHRFQPVVWLGVLVPFVAAVISLGDFLGERSPIAIRDEPSVFKIIVVGVLPIHLWSKIAGPDSTSFTSHRLGMIVKLRNESNAETLVDLALLSGCVSIKPFMVREMLTEGEKLPEPEVMDDAYVELQRSTIQAIRASGTIRENSRRLPPRGNGYVGVLFPIPPGRTGAILRVPRSVSLTGDCSKIENPSTQPATQQLFEIGAIHYSFPKDLAPEFRDGRLQVELYVGADVLRIEPQHVGRLYSLKWERWVDLDLPRMYEVPDDSYPPTSDGEQ